jgi:hypothetical protein
MVFYFKKDFKELLDGHTSLDRSTTTAKTLSYDDADFTTAVFLRDSEKVAVNLGSIMIESITEVSQENDYEEVAEEFLIREISKILHHEYLHKALNGTSKTLKNFENEERILDEIAGTGD